MKKELQQSWLIQRLDKPYKSESKLGTLGEAFAFGGGLKNGGLSEDAMKLLRPIFSFDYMGSAEFEFGAIPKSFDSIAKHINEYSTHEISINDVPVYIICVDDLKTEIDNRINEVAKNKVRLKEWSGFPAALGLDKYSKKEDCRHIGWFDIDNKFLFFTDQTAFEKTAKLFGLHTKV